MIRICPRFSLRTLLIVWTVLLLIVACFGQRLHVARNQYNAVKKLKAHYISVTYGETETTNELSWLEELLGVDFLDVTYVSINLGPAGHKESREKRLELFVNQLSQIRNPHGIKVAVARADYNAMRTLGSTEIMKNIKGLTLNCPVDFCLKGDEQGLKYLHNINVTRIGLRGKEIKDSTLAHFEHWPGLRTIYLVETNITDEGLQKISQLPALKEVAVDEGSIITDKGFQYLEKIPALEILRLSQQTQIKGTTLQSLAKHSHLKELYLGACDLDDVSIALLPSLPSLRVLDISENPRITKQSLPHLNDFIQHLETLDIRSTGIPYEDCERIRKMIFKREMSQFGYDIE